MGRVYVIAQGGGPTAVINQTVAGATLAARQRHPDATVLGARHGVRGLRDGAFVDLSSLSEADLGRFAATPNAGLGSTRDKPDETYCGRILERLHEVRADAFIYIGGNDTAGTLAILDRADDSPMTFVHAPKTIDNDLVENDHTPGFISAASFVAHAFASVDLDFRAMPGIYVGIVMGRHAGFLTAAAAAWRQRDEDGPHLLYPPEHHFSVGRLVAEVGAARDRYGRCVVAMSEGVTTEDGRPLAESIAASLDRDAHGNLQLSTGDLGVAMQDELNEAFPKVRARVDTFGYLPRAFSATVDPVDAREAFAIGAFALAAADEESCSVTLGAEAGMGALRRVPLGAVAGRTRLMPPGFVDGSGTGLAAEGRAYFARLLPEPPPMFSPFL